MENKAGKITKKEDNFLVKLSSGEYLSTIHPQNGIVPITWECKFNTKKKIKQACLDIFRIQILN